MHETAQRKLCANGLLFDTSILTEKEKESGTLPICGIELINKINNTLTYAA